MNYLINLNIGGCTINTRIKQRKCSRCKKGYVWNSKDLCNKCLLEDKLREPIIENKTKVIKRGDKKSNGK